MSETKWSILGDFLRKTREQCLPEDFGFESIRRRTTGLRREEVAILAGISVTWITWLEQGRAEGVSREILQSLATALRMTEDQKNYIFQLVTEETHSSAIKDIPTSAHQVLQALSVPAYLMNPYWEIICWNEEAVTIFGDFARLPPRDRNMMWYMFTNPTAQAVTVSWENHAQQMVARFRADYASYVDDSCFNQWITELCEASEVFATLWQSHPIEARTERTKKFKHPTMGELAFSQTTMQLIDNPHLRLVVFTPIPDTKQA